MKFEEFEPIFDKLFHACLPPPEKTAEKVYAARQDAYWYHFQHVLPEFFKSAVSRYLAEATDGPFFPACGAIAEISGDFAREAKERAEKDELARLRQQYPDAAKQAAENAQLVASLTDHKKLQ